MARSLTLDVISIDDPCPLPWDALPGNERVKHCGTCDQNVYDLSQMTEEAALSLIEETEGRLCVQYYERADGTVTTVDCAPSRMERARRNARRALAGAGTMYAMLVAMLMGLAALVLGWVAPETAAPVVEKLETVEKMMMPSFLPPPPVVEPPADHHPRLRGRMHRPPSDPVPVNAYEVW